jgi:hypothetical protein
VTSYKALSIAGALIYLLSIFNAWTQSAEVGAAPSAQHSEEVGVVRTKAESDQGRLPDPATALARTEPVITIPGLCEDKTTRVAAATNSCVTVVTREAFEKLLNSMNVAGKTLSSETRRNLAETYAQYLALERPATKAGLENTPQFAEIMRWWRLRTLADLYRGGLQAQFKNPSRDEVHSYYVEHTPSYQRITVDRILIPRPRGTTDDAKLADDKALTSAKAAHERLVNGEQPELVQKDVYVALGITSPSLTNLGSLGRAGFPPEQSEELFSLAPGKVSKVETEAASYVVYKIASKDTLSEDAVKDEISRQLAQRKFNDAIRSINESAKPEFNEAYFGPPVTTPPVAYPGPVAMPHP